MGALAEQRLAGWLTDEKLESELRMKKIPGFRVVGCSGDDLGDGAKSRNAAIDVLLKAILAVVWRMDGRG